MKTIAITIATLAAATVLAADNDPRQRQDLQAVIALQGKPCGEVVSYVQNGEKDFLATCKDKNKYRVYVRDGRVVVEKK